MCVEIGVARLAEVMSAEVGAASVRPLELCLWVGLGEVAGWVAEKRRRMCRMAGAGLVEAGSPPPARHALSAYPRGGAAEAGRRLGLLGPLASVVPRPPPRPACPPSDGRAEWCRRETGPAEPSICRTFTATWQFKNVSAA